ncbi:MAG: argininosuccinate synthase [Acidobacteria bacterium]|nr:MAG: argininosuccinate synthase [Acidobacteriota bacterium]
MTRKKLVLAYSGGLDTSVVLHQLANEGDWEVIAVLADVGQDEDLDAARERAVAAGASEAYIADLQSEFASEFVAPALAANALYERRYPLISALSRPCIARALVRIASERGAAAVAHGCTGKGNDQVRFEVSIRALDPELEVLAPIRTSRMNRDEAMEYAAEHGIPVKATKKSPYSIDMNLLGRTAECGVLEDPWNEPPEDAFEITSNPLEAAQEPEQVVVEFDQGLPSAIDGEICDIQSAIEHLDKVGGRFGFGRIDMVENRRVGIKSREIYEAPGALALILAHADLEDLTLERDLLHEKRVIESRWADLVYDGLWFSPLKSAYDAFIAGSQERVCGEVRLRFAPGTCQVIGRRSPLALYDLDLATYEASDTFRHEDAEGFVRLFGLGIETWARKSPIE